jgi:hypothetical protein
VVVIDSDRLAGGLARLDPRDRELLGYSLGRRVPDQDLMRLYQFEPEELPRRRAEAIDRLAGLLGVERGEDMGALLQALLEPATWKESTRAAAPAPSAEPARPDPPAGPGEARPAAADTNGAGAPGTGSGEAQAEEPELVEREALAPQPIGPELDFGAPVTGAPQPRGRGARIARRVALWTGGTVGMLGLVGGAALFGASRASNGSPPSSGDSQTRLFVPERGGGLAYPFPSTPPSAPCHPTATVRGRTTLYRRPRGHAMLRIASHTEWHSPRVLGVARRRGRWLAVQAPELANHRVGWLPSRRAELGCVRWAVHVDLSRRLLVVRRDGNAVHRFAVAIGSASHPTPRGRFSVTDKLRVRDPASPYGCCVLALTGHQTRLPADWPGGDRLAIHAAKDPSSIGQAVSLGCMRVSSAEARWLLRTVPLGTPIFIRS